MIVFPERGPTSSEKPRKSLMSELASFSVVKRPRTNVPTPEARMTAAAVILASGVGTFVLGLFTTLNEASSDINDFLGFSDDVGPLSGKTIISTAAFFVAWAVLAYIWRRREVAWR